MPTPGPTREGGKKLGKKKVWRGSPRAERRSGEGHREEEMRFARFRKVREERDVRWA